MDDVPSSTEHLVCRFAPKRLHLCPEQSLAALDIVKRVVFGEEHQVALAIRAAN